MAKTPRVDVFFYGSYINHRVLAEVDLTPERIEVASLPGFDIHIGPLANLVPSDRHTAWGTVADLSHPELDRLYAHAAQVLGGVYLPEAVLVRRQDGSYLPALTYIAHDLEPGPADPAYVGRIVDPARALGFPAWYIERLESFRRS